MKNYEWLLQEENFVFSGLLILLTIIAILMIYLALIEVSKKLKIYDNTFLFKAFLPVIIPIYLFVVIPFKFIVLVGNFLLIILIQTYVTLNPILMALVGYLYHLIRGIIIESNSWVDKSKQTQSKFTEISKALDIDGAIKHIAMDHHSLGTCFDDIKYTEAVSYAKNRASIKKTNGFFIMFGITIDNEEYTVTLNKEPDGDGAILNARQL